jgi:hypothetical protein
MNFAIESPLLHKLTNNVYARGKLLLRLSLLGTSATNWPIVPPSDEYGAFDGWELAGETEALGGNLPQYHFVHQKSHMTCPGIETVPPRWEAGD